VRDGHSGLASAVPVPPPGRRRPASSLPCGSGGLAIAAAMLHPCCPGAMLGTQPAPLSPRCFMIVASFGICHVYFVTITRRAAHSVRAAARRKPDKPGTRQARPLSPGSSCRVTPRKTGGNSTRSCDETVAVTFFGLEPSFGPYPAISGHDHDRRPPSWSFAARERAGMAASGAGVVCERAGVACEAGGASGNGRRVATTAAEVIIKPVRPTGAEGSHPDKSCRRSRSLRRPVLAKLGEQAGQASGPGAAEEAAPESVLLRSARTAGANVRHVSRETSALRLLAGG